MATKSDLTAQQKRGVFQNLAAAVAVAVAAGAWFGVYDGGKILATAIHLVGGALALRGFYNTFDGRWPWEVLLLPTPVKVDSTVDDATSSQVGGEDKEAVQADPSNSFNPERPRRRRYRIGAGS